MKTVIITGSNGQLGSSINKIISNNNFNDYNFIFTTKDDLDLTEESSIRDFFLDKKIYAVINCAAYTAVDLAEQEQEICNKINAEAVKIIAQECEKQNAWLIHISTDYVFDGNNTKPYLTDSNTNPQSIYGETKLLGEKYAQQYNNKTIIIRTAWVYSPYGKNFVKTMKFLFESKQEISVVADQKGIPTLAEDLANAILKILKTENKEKGIFHYSNSQETTWFDFAIEIKKILEQNNVPLKIQKINPIQTSEYPTPAKRPNYSVLDLNKIINTYNVEVFNWKESLNKMINQIL